MPLPRPSDELAHRFIGREHTRWGILRGTSTAAISKAPREEFFFTDARRVKLVTVAHREP